MATTAVAPSAAAASGDADSGMSKYYASKIGELSAVSCVRAKGLRRMLIGMFCASLLGLRSSSNFWLWRYPSVCGGIGPVRAPRTVYYRDYYVGREKCVLVLCLGGRMRCGRLSSSRYEQDVCLLVHFVYMYLPLARGCL